MKAGAALGIVITMATLMVACLGAWLFGKLKIKIGYMIGALLTVAIYNLIFENAYFPIAVRPAIQIISGCFICMNISKEKLAGIRQLITPILVYFLCIMIIPALTGCLIAACTALNLPTAMLASAPGGTTDMTLLSYDYGADTSYVATLHILRMVLGMSVFPLLSEVYAKRFPPKYEIRHTGQGAVTNGSSPAGSKKDILLTAMVAAAAGSIGAFSGIPAGALSFSAISVTVFNLCGGHAYLPKRIRLAAQICAGAIVGMSINRAGLLELTDLFLPFGIITAEYLLLNYVVGPLISRLFHLDLLTMLLACTPAGVSNTALIADDLGCDSSFVAIFQLIRLLSSIVVYPYLLHLLMWIFPRL